MKLIFFWTLFVFPILSSSGLLPLAVNAPSTLERSHVCSVSWLSLSPLSTILINHCHHHLSPSTFERLVLRWLAQNVTQLPLTDLSPFPGSLTHLGASRRLRGQRYIKARPIQGHILMFFDPPLPTQSNFLAKNSLYRCPTYSISCFMLNSQLLGVL